MTYFVKKRGRDIEQLAPLEVEPDPSFFTEQEDVLMACLPGWPSSAQIIMAKRERVEDPLLF